MEQSPSSEANRSSANREIPQILWNPNVHYRIHKCPTTDPIQSQNNPVHAFPSHVLNVQFKIILSSLPRSSKWSFPSGHSTENLYALLLLPLSATCPTHPILLDSTNQENVRKLFQATKQRDRRTRRLLPVLPIAREYFSRYLEGFLCGISHFLCTYFTICRKTSNDVVRNPASDR